MSPLLFVAFGVEAFSRVFLEDSGRSLVWFQLPVLFLALPLFTRSTEWSKDFLHVRFLGSASASALAFLRGAEGDKASEEPALLTSLASTVPGSDMVGGSKIERIFLPSALG